MRQELRQTSKNEIERVDSSVSDIQQRDAAAKDAQIDMDKLSHECCALLKTELVAWTLRSNGYRVTFQTCTVN